MVYLAGEINMQMYLDVAKRLDKRPNRVNLCLNSEGGLLFDALAIYDRLKWVPDCTITATGQCASGATIVMQAAKFRRATPFTQFCVHLAVVETAKDTSLKVHMDQVLYEIYASRTSLKQIEEALKREVFGAKDALRYGLIDEVWNGK